MCHKCRASFSRLLKTCIRAPSGMLGAAALLLLVLLVLRSGGGSAPQHVPAPSPTATPRPEMMGMVVRDPWYDFGTFPDMPNQPNYAAQDRMGAMLAQLGVRWVRIEFHIEGSDAYSVTQVARNDYFIRQVAPRYNLKILGLLGYGVVRDYNPFLLGLASEEHDPLYGVGIDHVKRTWLDRARMIVNRYQGDIAAYEVLNEPNRLSHTGEDGLPAAQVALLHTTFYSFFRHIDRAAPGSQAWRDDVPIILGGIQPAGTGRPNHFGYISDREYLSQLYTSNEFLDYYATYGRFPLDGLGYHPYPDEIARSQSHTAPNPAELPAPTTDTTTPTPQRSPQHDLELMLNRLDRMRDRLVALGDPLQPFWITEIGYNVGYPRRSETVQADFLRLVYTRLASRSDVERIFWFKYEDFPPASGPTAQKWGKVVIPFVPDTACPGGACYESHGHHVLLRPAFWAYRELAGKAPAPEPPSSIIINGPSRGAANQQLSFTATISRSTATMPITYTWRASGHTEAVHHGAARHNSVTFSWPYTGTYAISVEGSNTGGTVINSHLIHIYEPGNAEALENNQPPATSSQPDPHRHRWLIADN